MIAEDLQAAFYQRTERKLKLKAKVQGRDLELLEFEHPFYSNKQVPIILGEHVTTEGWNWTCAYCSGSWFR